MLSRCMLNRIDVIEILGNVAHTGGREDSLWKRLLATQYAKFVSVRFIRMALEINSLVHRRDSYGK